MIKKQIIPLFILLIVLTLTCSSCGNNLSISEITYNVSGYVTDINGVGMENVILNFASQGSTQTTADGYYQITGLKKEISITPALDGYSFEPNTTTVNQEQNNVDFIGQKDNHLPQRYTFKIINEYPHDIEAFTQGLYYEKDSFYEGTGLYGQSDMRKVDLQTGEILDIYKLGNQYFGEGITLLNEKIYQSTWKSNTMFIYDKHLNLIKKTQFPFYCWGLTDDDLYLIMSDGTSLIRYIDPNKYEVSKEIKVTINNEPINNINELEYINGKIYANIWQSNTIIIINPHKKKVDGIIDLSGIINPHLYQHELNVLNGIAYDPDGDRLFVTGKLWPKLFEIELIPK